MRTGKPAVTLQRWVNELAEFSLFFLHYKPGKKYIIADTLNCKPQKSNLKHKKLCTEAHPVETAKILLGSSDWTQENQKPVSVSLNTVSIKEQINILNGFTT